MNLLLSFVWLYIMPARLRAQRSKRGPEALLRAGTWFGSTLLWLPTAIPMLGFYLELTPRATVAQGFVQFALTTVAASWLLGGLVGWIDARWSTIVLGAFAGLGVLGAIGALVGAWALSPLMGAFTTLSLVAVCCIAVATYSALIVEAGAPALLFISPLMLRILVMGAGLQALIALGPLVPDAWNYGWRGIVMGLLFLTVLIGGGGLVLWGLQRLLTGLTLQLIGGNEPLVGRATLATLVLCVGLLGWVYLLGGWRALL